MESKRKALRSKYEAYTDEALLEAISPQKNRLPEETRELIESILIERGIDYKGIQDEGSAVLKLDLPNGNKIYSLGEKDEERFIVTERIDSLVARIEKDEKEAQQLFEREYRKSSDSELLMNYNRITNKLLEQNEFGSGVEEDSLNNVRLLLNFIEERQLSIPEDQRIGHDHVDRMIHKALYKSHLQDGVIRLIVGILAIIPIGMLIMAVGLRGTLLEYLFVIIAFLGLRKMFSGIRFLSRANEKFRK